MCHGRLRRSEERSEYARGERLWDLFYRETEHSPPPVPIARRDEERAEEPEPEVVLIGTSRPAHDPR
jgi:hypothetical protein